MWLVERLFHAFATKQTPVLQNALTHTKPAFKCNCVHSSFAAGSVLRCFFRFFFSYFHFQPLENFASWTDECSLNRSRNHVPRAAYYTHGPFINKINSNTFFSAHAPHGYRGKEGRTLVCTLAIKLIRII